jgi:hypothetical protein
LPSDDRLKELVVVCYHRKILAQRRDDIARCLVDVCRLQEQTGTVTSQSLKEVLVIVDSI